MLFTVSELLGWTTGWANQLFWIELLSLFCLVHSLGTIFSTSKVGLTAFITLKISIDSLGIFIWVVIVF
jgi:hypothetical protein